LIVPVNTANKVCPVVLRGTEPDVEILAFEHPLAGRQLVKGSIEAGESIEAAALRELEEESGLTAVRATRHLGVWESGFEGQVWAFVLCESADRRPESWLHGAPDDGGLDFRFFWHPLLSAVEPGHWHAVFRGALIFIAEQQKLTVEEVNVMTAVDIGQRLVPALLVRDMNETLAFYRKLGFALTRCHPSPAAPNWAEVTRDSVVFQFHTEPPHGTPSAPVFSGTLYLYPASVAALAEELRGKVEFAWGPEVMDYGMNEFAIQDPNGYFIAFTEPALHE